MTKCYQLARLFFHYNIKVGDNIHVFLISIDLARIHLFLSLHLGVFVNFSDSFSENSVT